MALVGHQPGVFERRQVMAQRRLTDIEMLGKLPRRAIALAQQLQNAPSRWIGKRLKTLSRHKTSSHHLS